MTRSSAVSGPRPRHYSASRRRIKETNSGMREGNGVLPSHCVVKRREFEEEQTAAGEVLPPSNPLTGPRLAPALGLRAGTDGFFIVSQTNLKRRTESCHSPVGCGAFVLSPEAAFGQPPPFPPPAGGGGLRWGQH